MNHDAIRGLMDTALGQFLGAKRGKRGFEANAAAANISYMAVPVQDSEVQYLGQFLVSLPHQRPTFGEGPRRVKIWDAVDAAQKIARFVSEKEALRLMESIRILNLGEPRWLDRDKDTWCRALRCWESVARPIPAWDVGYRIWRSILQEITYHNGISPTRGFNASPPRVWADWLRTLRFFYRLSVEQPGCLRGYSMSHDFGDLAPAIRQKMTELEKIDPCVDNWRWADMSRTGDKRRYRKQAATGC